MIRDKTLGIRLTEEEYNALQSEADKDYINISVKARQILFKALNYSESPRVKAIKQLEKAQRYEKNDEDDTIKPNY